LNRNRGLGIYAALVVLIVVVMYLSSARQTSSISYKDFKSELSKGNIKNATIVQNKEVPTGSVTFTIKGSDNGKSVLYVSDINDIIKLFQDQNVNYTLQDVPRTSWMDNFLPMLIVIAIVFVLFMVILGNHRIGSVQDGSSVRMNDFGKSRARMTRGEDIKIRFKDVAGLKEEKEQLREVVNFLKEPEAFTKVGARIPKGVLLVGPPGTGKTLLAKAVAGEAGVPFFSISGSDFVEMFVGVGASRVRDLFQEAKKNAPCIIFIDEIDAVARRRGAGLGGSHDEREQTLNQMLVEMDGFDINEGIMVLAATNRVDILDPAIMRPGRFDRKVAVGRPDIRERREILDVHAKNKPLADDVNLDELARTTAGYTGADLENLLNEAAIEAATEKRHFITEKDIKDAFVLTGLGTEKKSHIISDKEKRITAYHESGHAILFHLLPDVGPVYSISIIPTGVGAAGYTMPLPERDEIFLSRNEMLEDIEVSLGGRIAEELIFDDITTGASNDLEKATQTARDMVIRYGMSEKVGHVSYENDNGEVFLGKDLAEQRPYGERVATDIDEEVRDIIESCYAKAKKILEDNMDILHASAKLLLEKEKVSGSEFEALFAERG
jgi:cell division protease FtsH